MNAPDGPAKLPAAIRNVSILCMGFSAAVGFFSISELLSLVNVGEAPRSAVRLPGPFGTEPFQRALEAQLSALESMRVARALILASLGVASALNLVAASRLIAPRGWRRVNQTAPALPRAAMRRLVVSSSIAVAVLRTLDGAQIAVVARRVGEAMGRSAAALPGFASANPSAVEAKLRSWAIAVAVMQTAAVVASYAFFSQYFRRSKVRNALAALDQPR